MAKTKVMAVTPPASGLLLPLSSSEARLFVRAWMLGFLIVLLLLG